MFFQTHKGSVTSFSILFNFQGPVAPSASRLTAYLLYHRSGFCQALFLKFFVFLERVIPYQPLGFRPDFYVLILVLPFHFSAALRSHSFVPHLVLEYNTTLPPSCQHFFTDFFKFFPLSLFLWVFSSVLRLHGRAPELASFSSFNVIIKGHRIDTRGYYTAE